MLWPRPVQWLPGELTRLVMPPVCAGCGGELEARITLPGPRLVSDPNEPLEHSDRRVPYCNTCRAEHPRQAAAARLLGSLGALFGVACALAVPLAWPEVSMDVLLFAAGVFSLLPLALSGFRRHGARPSARVWGLPFVGTIAEHPSFAARLAQANASRARRLWLPPIVYRVVFWGLPAACVGLAAASHVWHHPRLHVVNTSAGGLWVEVDGLPRVGVPAAPRGGSSHQSARLPRGRRRFVVRDERGQLVADTWVQLEGGREHLFAPGAVEHCFWLETTGYGKDASFVVVPLASASRFYTLAIEIDSWFGEGPEPASGDRRSSGGRLTALHQAPCTRAPIAVRRAASAIGP